MAKQEKFIDAVIAGIDRHRDLVSRLLIVVGIALLVFPLATQLHGVASQYQLKRNWEAMAERQALASRRLEKQQLALYGVRKFQAEESILRSAPASSRPAKKNGPFPNVRIIIPKIELDQVVVEGAGPESLKNGPGHYPETVDPGDRGNVAVAGHRVTYTHPFNRIDELQVGDVIVLETLDATYEYKVTGADVRDPSDTTNLRPSPDARLTLTTCTPKYSAASRLNIVATLFKTTERETGVLTAVKNALGPVKEQKPVVIVADDLSASLDKAVAALRKNPKDAGTHLKTAQIYFEIGRYREAIEHLKAARNLAPGRRDVQELGVKVAEKEAQLRSDASSEDNPSVKLSIELDLGEMLFGKGDYPGAIAAFEAASALDPFAADILYKLGVVYEKAGENGRALEALGSAVQYSPNYQEAVAELAALKSRIEESYKLR
ncbi:MAG: sortase [Chloroflexi bacterium]|nr:sortase [Chloroflexota bacterium]